MKILVVDDEEFVTFNLRDQFRRRGHEVQTATSVVEATRLAQECHFDIVVADIHIPGGGGLRMLERLKDQNNCVGTVFLIVTDSEEQTEREKCTRLGAEDYFRRPLSASELVFKVEGFESLVHAAGKDHPSTKHVLRPPHLSIRDKEMGLKKGRIRSRLTRRNKRDSRDSQG